MAKVKSYAVDVEVTIKRTLYVDARRPNGAKDKLLTEEGWREATRYEDDDCLPLRPDATVTVTRVREAG